MNANFKKLFSRSKRVLVKIKDKLAAPKLGHITQASDLATVKSIFRLRDKVFFNKKKATSLTYPFTVIDPFDVFGTENLVGDFNLVGDEWRNKYSEKPVALLWGFNNWKWGFVSDYLPEYRTAFAPRKILALQSLLAIRKFPIKPAAFIFWGYTEPAAVRRYAQKKDIPIFRMEDGFIRSSSLGASHSTPYSLVLDAKGLHYNSDEVSEIEEILNTHIFSEEELVSAQKCMNLMSELALSKYNPSSLNNTAYDVVKVCKRVAVLGQVDNDMSIRLGNTDGWTMMDLIRLAKIENPGAEIIYRPHPDIYQGFQKSKFKKRSVEKICQISSPNISLVDFLRKIDHVYTISSLSGLEALIKGKKVTVVGAAFYAGWGLTDDRIMFPRRTNKRTIQEVFAAIYLKYPRYLANIDDSEIGFKAACLRIKADQEVANYDLAKKTDLSNAANVEQIAKSDYWPQLFFANKSPDVLKLSENLIASIDFTKLFALNEGRLFQSTVLYAMCGRMKSDAARNSFITTVRKYIDIDILNELIISLSEYYPSNYVMTHLAWLLTENKENETSLKVLSFHLRKLKTCQEKENTLEGSSGGNDVESKRMISAERKAVTYEQSEVLLNLLENHFEHKNFDEAVKIANTLLISNYGTNSLLLRLAKIAELKFDYTSARSIARFCQKIDLFGENRKAISIELSSLSDSQINDEPLQALKSLALEIKLNPERINNSFILGKKYFKEEAFQKTASVMLRLDSNKSIQKAFAYLEVGQPEKALSIIEHLALNGDFSDKLKVAYSKVLSALGRYGNALAVMADARRAKATELNFRESLRLFTYLGMFEDGLRLIKEAEKKKVFLSEAVLIPIYLGAKNIEAGYKCYLDVPFRQEVIRYFPQKYMTTEDLSVDKLLMLSVYGPGDEIRFASLYGDFSRTLALRDFGITCDYRLINILKRSFPEIQFHPVKRTRDYSPLYPRELYDRLPGSELHTILDNNSVDLVKNSNKILMVTDLIWRFRKGYESFPGLAYLKHDEQLAAHYSKRLPKKDLLIGLSWRSSLMTHARSEHYLSVQELEPIFNIDGVQFVNFQYDECEEELAWIEKRYPGKIINVAEIDHFNDFEGVAALMTCMDLMIAPATTVVELAGALGCPTSLLSNSAELHWRKIDSSGTDVWHNSVTHVEGEALGDKHSLVRNLYKKIVEMKSWKMIPNVKPALHGVDAPVE
jgi:capsular polysaccharide export protein